MKSYAETLEEILAEIASEQATEGSMILHIAHDWDREREEGIWCNDCDTWVMKIPEG